MSVKETKCRHCGKRLLQPPHCFAYDPDTGETAPNNFFGGPVCSRRCDVNECLRMLSSMPGAGLARTLDSGCREQVDINWPEEE